ncbi:MAG: hypothetical protein WBG30_02755 [Psychrilyobacter sp.]|uniref:hypothetical protein n=1 Tax=Psychrilyobacter sp. TaxID=2586924 RepID=UPI003C734E7A
MIGNNVVFLDDIMMIELLELVKYYRMENINNKIIFGGMRKDNFYIFIKMCLEKNIKHIVERII